MVAAHARSTSRSTPSPAARKAAAMRRSTSRSPPTPSAIRRSSRPSPALPLARPPAADHYRHVQRRVVHRGLRQQAQRRLGRSAGAGGRRAAAHRHRCRLESYHLRLAQPLLYEQHLRRRRRSPQARQDDHQRRATRRLRRRLRPNLLRQRRHLVAKRPEPDRHRQGPHRPRHPRHRRRNLRRGRHRHADAHAARA